MKISPLAAILACTLVATIAACSDDDTNTPAAATSGGPDGGGPVAETGPPTGAKDIVDTAASAGSFGTLVTAVKAADLESTLRGPGPFTVFAPTDAAFAKLPKDLTDKLLSAPYKTELSLILRYHVLSGSVKAADVLGKTSTPATVLGAKLSVNGSNGVVINGVATVTTPDVQASNGIVHAIGDVLLPTIADTATGYDDGTTTFKTLVAALTAAELAETLAGPGPFTVFAPSDAAFAKIPKATLDSLLLPENKAKLQTILKYHVVSGAPVFAKAVAPGTITSLSGAITVSASGSDLLIDAGGAKAKIVFTDLPASNGVTHVIDTVILPPS